MEVKIKDDAVLQLQSPEQIVHGRKLQKIAAIPQRISIFKQIAELQFEFSLKIHYWVFVETENKLKILTRDWMQIQQIH